MKKRSKKGFTLIELIVVIVILGILALIAIPRFADVTNNAKDKAALTEHRMAVSAVHLAMADNDGALPTSAQVDNFIQGGQAALKDTVLTFTTPGQITVTSTSKSTAATVTVSVITAT